MKTALKRKYYEEKIESLEKEVLDQKEEIIKLKSIVGGMAK